MKHVIRKLCMMGAFGAALVAGSAQASVVIEGTRVIFPAQEREVTIKVVNNGLTPALVQTWLDKGDVNASPDTIDVPFVLTPAMFRLDPAKGQTLRMIYSNEPLAQDKETLFWLNVLEVPPKAQSDGGDSNKLQLAFRSRIKVLFRPQGLPGAAGEAPSKVTWEVVRDANGSGYALKASNPTAYYVNLGQVTLKDGGTDYNAGANYVAPRETRLFPVADLSSQPGIGAQVEYIGINDYGAGVKATHSLDAKSVQ
ncbi:fimbrial biogenesis chaperone [Dyella sp. 20L07]|uniref:fimbrial biogenesis chaperone n=1 Tax=Dyella sp. 20L07 TaxID=3384240 RepID=UPI003D2BCA34